MFLQTHKYVILTLSAHPDIVLRDFANLPQVVLLTLTVVEMKGVKTVDVFLNHLNLLPVQIILIVLLINFVLTIFVDIFIALRATNVQRILLLEPIVIFQLKPVNALYNKILLEDSALQVLSAVILLVRIISNPVALLEHGDILFLVQDIMNA